MFSGVCRSAWGFFHALHLFRIYANFYVLQHECTKSYSRKENDVYEENHRCYRDRHIFGGHKGFYRGLTNQNQARNVRYFAKGGDILCHALQRILS